MLCLVVLRNQDPPSKRDGAGKMGTDHNASEKRNQIPHALLQDISSASCKAPALQMHRPTKRYSGADSIKGSQEESKASNNEQWLEPAEKK
ncbi:unnamed protein product [Bubo scandiacus]